MSQVGIDGESGCKSYLEGVGGDAPLVQQPTDSLGVFQRFGDNYSAHLVIEKKRSLIGQLLVNAVV